MASPRFIKHLRQDTDFREAARYPGSIPVTAMMPGQALAPAQLPFVNNPNALLFGGGGVAQASFVNGVPVMPKNKIVAFSRKAIAA